MSTISPNSTAQADPHSDTPDTIALVYLYRKEGAPTAELRKAVFANPEKLSLAKTQRLFRESCLDRDYFHPAKLGLQDLAKGQLHEFFALDIVDPKEDGAPLPGVTLNSMLERFQAVAKRGWVDAPAAAEGGVDPALLAGDESYRYQLLGRLQSDCEHYFDLGAHNKNKLWALDEKDHVRAMKTLWHSFDEDKKPQWLSMEAIEAYEARFNEVLESAPRPERPRG